MMLCFYDLFKHIYVITIDKEKYLSCLDELKNKLKLNNNHINKFDGIIINQGNTLEGRQLGCKLSHLKIIEIAKQNNFENVVIFEDDIQILGSFFNSLHSIKNFLEKNNNNWDLLYLGGNHNQAFEQTEFENIVKCSRTLTTHAYIINNKCYDIILNEASKNTELPIDILLADMIQKIRKKSYCLSPRKIIQKQGFSYIQNKVIDYNRYLYDAHIDNL